MKPSNCLVFPLRIFSDMMKPLEGVWLTNFYVSDRKVLFYVGIEEQFVFDVFLNSVRGEKIKSDFVKEEMEVVLHHLVPPVEGRMYEYILRSGGQLELREVENE